jgi:orc1/cdc6 family replication initiation protein
VNRLKHIIRNAQILTADYLPNKLVHREGERQEIARNLEPVLGDGRPDDMLLYGPPGTGKTAMARYVVQELKEETFVQSSYVNCFSQKSRFEIFYELLDEKLTTPRDGTSTEKIVDMFEEKTKEEPTVVIIDEVDQVTDDEVLYELSRFKNVGMIFIANDSSVFAHFDDRVRSRLSGMDRIHFRKYDDDQMEDILELRREHGLKEGVLSDRLLSRIASSADGDARMGVNSLRLSARKAERNGLEEITEEVVEEAITDTTDQDRIESRDKLNGHQKAVEDILKEEGELKMGELYESYRTKVEEPKSRRTLRRYMRKMEAYDVIKSEGSKRWKKYSLAENSFYRT